MAAVFVFTAAVFSGSGGNTTHAKVGYIGAMSQEDSSAFTSAGM